MLLFCQLCFPTAAINYLNVYRSTTVYLYHCPTSFRHFVRLKLTF